LTTGTRCTVLVHPGSLLLLADRNEDTHEVEGQRGTEAALPDFVVYSEVVHTSQSFMRHVCVVDEAWVAPKLRKLHEVDVRRLMGGRALPVAALAQQSAAPTRHPAVGAAAAGGRDGAAVAAAKERYLARKRARER